MQLILGAGKHQRIQGAWHVDQFAFPGINQVVDLNKKPWGLASDTYLHVSALHVIEHLDSLIDFMNETHRVIKKGGSLYLETPEAGNDPDLEWADPTHKRCYRVYTFPNYFSLEGIEKWGYTDKAWCFYKCVSEEGVLKVHCSPIK